MPNLSNLTVDFVSLVDRPAVRDPEDPTDPMRFLLQKRDRKDQTMAEPTTTQEAAEQALELLKPHAKDIPQPLLAQISSLAGNGDPADEDDTGEDSLVKAMLELREAEEGIAKADGNDRLRQALRKAQREVQLEYLHRVSPGAARCYEEANNF
ncbi:MAG TPA: hypothetical protein VFI03_12235 [Solirubrobacterales bacterium]|nr:hypothetical protein [Solirubrobacterales bacterium]